MEPKIPVNVIVSKADEDRILREEKAWTGPKLVALLFVSLTIALVVLVVLANMGYQTAVQAWELPGF